MPSLEFFARKYEFLSLLDGESNYALAA